MEVRTFLFLIFCVGCGWRGVEEPWYLAGGGACGQRRSCWPGERPNRAAPSTPPALLLERWAAPGAAAAVAKVAEGIARIDAPAATLQQLNVVGCLSVHMAAQTQQAELPLLAEEASQPSSAPLPACASPSVCQVAGQARRGALLPCHLTPAGTVRANVAESQAAVHSMSAALKPEKHGQGNCVCHHSGTHTWARLDGTRPKLQPTGAHQSGKFSVCGRRARPERNQASRAGRLGNARPGSPSAGCALWPRRAARLPCCVHHSSRPKQRRVQCWLAGTPSEAALPCARH